MSKSELNQIEEYFQWWLDEMIAYNFIKSYEREPQTFVVLPTVEYGRIKRFRKKEKIVEKFNLFSKIEYTYDYRIVCTAKAEYLFYEEHTDTWIFQFGKPLFIAHKENDDMISYVDVKPTTSVMQKGGKVSTSITFPLKQRMLWEQYHLYINKVVPIPMAGTGFNSALFCKSFTPDRYRLTDGGGMVRKVKFQQITMAEYTRTKALEIENLLKLK